MAANSETRLSTMMLGAVGVVFGDIGTSPLYTLKTVFSGAALSVNEGNILGLVSIIFWSLVLVVSLKYLVFVMRADNHGEGGVISLTALALRPFRKEHYKFLMTMALGILGAGLFYGDSVITPAISVLTAIEGLKVAEPALHSLVIPLTLLVLTLLFLFQIKGTGTVGKFFGPVMIFWFFTIAVLGLISIMANPSVLRAFNPYYAVQFFLTNKFIGFIALGATFLALTGAEALYADMGHFGLRPIRLSWFWFVFPALILNYFGQGALLLENPQAISQPFYLLSPGWMLYPFILLATAATVIASQAVISGTFTMTQEAIRLGFLPVLDVRYTSERKKGQIYIGVINWLLFVAVIAVVLGFKSSDNLAAAYGLSVTGTMVITTILAFGVLIRLWKIKWWIIAPVFAVFFLIDISFLGSNSMKVLQGGWLPLSIAAVVFTLMATWQKGARLLKQQVAGKAVSFDTFQKIIAESPPARVPGTAVFLTPNATIIPPALLSNLIHNQVLHEQVVLLEIDFEDRPHVPEEQRIEITELQNNIYVAKIRYGFKDEIDVPYALQLSAAKALKFQMEKTTFFFGRLTLSCGNEIKMAQWRKRLFIGMFNNSKDFIDYCKIPTNRIVELGTSIEL